MMAGRSHRRKRRRVRARQPDRLNRCPGGEQRALVRCAADNRVAGGQPGEFAFAERAARTLHEIDVRAFMDCLDGAGEFRLVEFRSTKDDRYGIYVFAEACEQCSNSLRALRVADTGDVLGVTRVADDLKN